MQTYDASRSFSGNSPVTLKSKKTLKRINIYSPDCGYNRS